MFVTAIHYHWFQRFILGMGGGIELEEVEVEDPLKPGNFR
jgi:hypothetical protein